MVSNKNLFYLIFISVTLIFSLIGNTQTDVVIIGPDFDQKDYFIEELEAISTRTGYKIAYIPLNDVSAYLNNNVNEPDMAILTDPRSLKDLGESDILLPVNQFYSKIEIENYSPHLINLVSSRDNSELYGHWIRLFNNSVVWFNVDRYNQYGAPEFKTFDEIIEFTKNNSKEGNELWCLTIDSAENQPLLDYEYGESSGWIISNWLENIVLSNYGPEIYDLWSQNELKFSDDEIILSLLDVGKIIHNQNQIFKGKEYLIRSQVSNSAKNLASDSSTCVFSLLGHHSTNDFPSDKSFGKDYDFFNFKISCKASDVFLAVSAYYGISDTCDYPLHLGITEAGGLMPGTIKSSIGLGSLLWAGIGDTIRVSLSADPVEEIKVGFNILKSLNLRHRGVNVISCPSCARQNFNVIKNVEELEKRLEHITTPMTLSVIGCVVNGPGEARETNIGLTGGKAVIKYI